MSQSELSGVPAKCPACDARRKWRQAELQTQIASAANVESLRAKRAADDERTRAEEHFAMARDAVSQFVTQIEDDRRLEQAGLHDVRIKLLESAIPFFERLIERAPGDKSTEANRAEAHLRLAQIQSVTGQDATALENFREAIDGYRDLIVQFPDAAEHRQNLAGACSELGKLYQRTGDDESSRGMFDESVTLQQKLLVEDPGDPERRHVLAQILNNLACLLRDLGQTDEADRKFEQAVDIHKALIDQYPGVPEY